jgi:predicted DCC family thiol-disulfide oxidoreductase YuxK
MIVRSPLSIDAGDILMFFCLMFALFLHPSVVTRQPANRGLGVYLHNLAIAALYAQVILVYVNAGWLKLDVESAWYEGTALYYTTHLTNLPLPFEWMLPIFENSFIVTVGTYLSLVYLIGFPFALFSSYHWFWVLMGIGFHGGIAVLMGLYTFSLLMIGLTLLCVRDEEWAQWGQVVVNWAAKIVPSSAVYIDGYCSYCRATGSAIARFDWLRRVDVRDFRGDSSYRSLGITDSDLEAQMHLVGGGKILRGYDAVLGVLARVPLGMVFWPLAKLAGWLGLGPLAYRWLSEHRVIVPNSELCRTDACQVKGSTVLEDEP